MGSLENSIPKFGRSADAYVEYILALFVVVPLKEQLASVNNCFPMCKSCILLSIGSIRLEALDSSSESTRVFTLPIFSN